MMTCLSTVPGACVPVVFVEGQLLIVVFVVAAVGVTDADLWDCHQREPRLSSPGDSSLLLRTTKLRILTFLTELEKLVNLQ